VPLFLAPPWCRKPRDPRREKVFKIITLAAVARNHLREQPAACCSRTDIGAWACEGFSGHGKTVY
jgi:hypothetical protein